jgi:hypothetical protein
MKTYRLEVYGFLHKNDPTSFVHLFGREYLTMRNVLRYLKVINNDGLTYQIVEEAAE